MTARRMIRFGSLCVSAGDPRRAGRAHLLARVRARLAAVLGGDLESGRRARAEADARGRDRRGAAQHGLRRALRDRDRASPLPRHGSRQRARRPADGAVAGRRRPVALPPVRAAGLVRAVALGSRRARALRVPGHPARDDVRLAAVRRARGRARAARDRHRAGGGGGHARRARLHDVPAHHAAGDSLGRSHTASC